MENQSIFTVVRKKKHPLHTVVIPNRKPQLFLFMNLYL